MSCLLLSPKKDDNPACADDPYGLAQMESETGRQKEIFSLRSFVNMCVVLLSTLCQL